jgi:hypothetical protein
LRWRLAEQDRGECRCPGRGHQVRFSIRRLESNFLARSPPHIKPEFVQATPTMHLGGRVPGPQRSVQDGKYGICHLAGLVSGWCCGVVEEGTSRSLNAARDLRFWTFASRVKRSPRWRATQRFEEVEYAQNKQGTSGRGRGPRRRGSRRGRRPRGPRLMHGMS